jgi:hypothetical protein
MEKYIPKVGDTVRTTVPGFRRIFIIIGINPESETVDLESLPTSENSCILASVTWDVICFGPRQFNLEAIHLVCSFEMGHCTQGSLGLWHDQAN